MASVTREELLQIAQLARLHLEPAELDALQADLGAVLEHFAALARVETTDIAPMTHAVPLDLRLRADEPAPSLSAEVALAGAPVILPGAE
jgi:aspartyl-tRNA(Asn)/glutamyl-tRNA(Gln) amidotransferase subunit C